MLTKYQAFHLWISDFVNGNAFTANNVPEGAGFPRITYTLPNTEFDSVVSVNASIWYKSHKWEEILLKADEIYDNIGLGGKLLSFNDGAGKIWVKRGTPFSQPMDDEDSTIRRILLTFEIEILQAR